MTWVRLDDEFPAHRKIRRLSDAAFRIHISALCWAGKYLTDGLIAADDLQLLAGDIDDRMDPMVYEDALKQLVERNVWHPAKHDCPECPIGEDGWVIHDYLDINPSAEQVRTQRAQTAERQRRARERRAEAPMPVEPAPEEAVQEALPVDVDVTRDSHDAVTRESQRPTPTPTPTPKEKNKRASSPRGDGEPPGFAEFWAVYPKRKARAAAERAYRTALKKVTAERLLEAATSYRDDGTRQRNDPKFTKYPATWLNGGCWDDEPDQPTHTGPRPFWEN